MTIQNGLQTHHLFDIGVDVYSEFFPQGELLLHLGKPL